LLALGAAAFLIARGSPIITIAVSAVLGLILYKGPGPRQEKKVASDHVALLKNLGVPLFLVLVLLAGLLALHFVDRKFFDLSA